ncbi:hypothetical protein PRZ48_014419 [Zasmidium cellare]|uniref:RING-type domain-containing protein n=1 Tax=Zasmidium cellare TaxID=395010 RepID=A0ABR0DYP2_ZASCE|nr:hypothetical protein PRZ48_014419 [Zasmidium cellare]
MASPTARRRSVVIDLVSDDTSDDDIQEQPRPVRTPAPQQQATPGANNFAMDDFFDFNAGFPGAFPEEQTPQVMPTAPPVPEDQLDGEYLMIDGEQIFIPNSPGDRARSNTASNAQPSVREEQAAPPPVEISTFDGCLQHVMAVFPDVCHDHVRVLYDAVDSIPGSDRVEHIVNELLSKESYPKRDKGKKRKREDDEETKTELKRWEGPDREVVPSHLKGTITSMLKAEFPEATHNLIAELLSVHRNLYPTFLALTKSKEAKDGAGWRGRPPKGMLADADVIASNSGWNALSDELKAARKQAERMAAERRKENAKKIAEQQNLQRAIEAGETAECQACFEDLPMNRQIHCNGDVAHFTCFDCAETYIKSEVGDSRCRVLCTAGCGAGFAHAQLHQLSDKSLLERLEQLQQEKDIRDAGLDDLEECPFCDYKAILPPVEEDFEFRCMNPLCEKISCRRCKAPSHIPVSCEEYAKDNKINARHKIEEAMTAAMIRSCNKCKKQFIKEYGCNKMCYVCSESLKNYDHFDQGGAPHPNNSKKKCPLYDNVEERHEREVKEAEAAARAAAMSENPDVTEKDLEIKVSDAVQKATRDRIQRGAVGPGGVPIPQGYHHGGLFARMPRLGRYLAEEDADDDEDFDDDDDEDGDDFDFEELLNPPRRRRDPHVPRNNGVARPAHPFGQEHGQAAPAAADPLLGPAHPRIGPAAPRLHRLPINPYYDFNNARAGLAPANPPAPRMRGYIPVFGFRRQAPIPRAFQPAVPGANAPVAQPLEQAQPAANPPENRNLMNDLDDHLFGADPFVGFDAPAGAMAPVPPPAPAHEAAPQDGHAHQPWANQLRLQQQRLMFQQQQAMAAARQRIQHYPQLQPQQQHILDAMQRRIQQAQQARVRAQHQQMVQQWHAGQNAGLDEARQAGGWNQPGGPHAG